VLSSDEPMLVREASRATRASRICRCDSGDWGVCVEGAWEEERESEVEGGAEIEGWREEVVDIFVFLEVGWEWWGCDDGKW